MNAPNAKVAEQLWLRAHESIRRGELASAVRDLAKAFEILKALQDPRLAQVHARWVDVHKMYKEESAGGGARSAEKAATPRTLQAQAEAAANEGELPKAIALYERIVAESPANELAKERLAELRQAVGRAQALSHPPQAAAQSPAGQSPAGQSPAAQAGAAAAAQAAAAEAQRQAAEAAAQAAREQAEAEQRAAQAAEAARQEAAAEGARQEAAAEAARQEAAQEARRQEAQRQEAERQRLEAEQAQAAAEAARQAAAQEAAAQEAAAQEAAQAHVAPAASGGDDVAFLEGLLARVQANAGDARARG